MFSNNHQLFQQLRKLFLNVFFLKARFLIDARSTYVWLKSRWKNPVEKEEKMDYFYQEREPVESTATRIVESDRFQVHVDVVTFKGRYISLRE